eukprot:TRINITY_DN3219_c0_g4_i1.p1 TRINITY_DN3219_c0_g4~~TRINITY_DN3219_c0_g4_i1.p1  ORF type:complete len:259 (+),score=83.12 TRINITY_DN3219_c0_g4_i1:41-778(+)
MSFDTFGGGGFGDGSFGGGGFGGDSSGGFGDSGFGPGGDSGMGGGFSDPAGSFGGGDMKQEAAPTSFQASPSKANASKRDQTLIPITCKQFNNLVKNEIENTYQVYERPIYEVRLVGCLSNVVLTDSQIKCELNDGTGVVNIQGWSSDPNKQQILRDGVYVSIVGHPNDGDQAGSKDLAIHSFKPVEDSNQIVHHLLECAYVKKFFTRGPLKPMKKEDKPAAAPMNNAGMGGGMSFAGQSSGFGF